jgi:cytochrome c553
LFLPAIYQFVSKFQGNMMKKQHVLYFEICLIALLFAPVAAFAVDGNTILSKGGANPAALPCTACHGDDLMGNGADIPRIAGLPAAYIVKQLNDFRADLRHNILIQPVAKALSEDEITAVANVISVRPKINVLAAIPDNPAPDTAAWLVTRGDWARNIPPCSSCHGPNGIGVGSVFPPLAGKSATYLQTQLHAFKGKLITTKQGGKKMTERVASRYNDPNGIMRHIAASLSDIEIKKLADYFASMEISDTPVAADRIFIK